MKRQIERGSALVIAVIVVVIMSILAIGLIRLGTLETAGAMAGAKHEALAQCADSAAKLLMSKFHLLGAQPLSITALNVPMDGPLGHMRAVGGHIGTNDAMTVKVEQVAALGDTQMAGAQKVDSIGNRDKAPGVGKQPLKVTVHCVDHGDPADPQSGRQLEVELGILFGL
jgi:hypothetical protein